MTTNIDQLFSSFQDRLQVSLNVARGVIGHAATKGEACEVD